MNELLKCPYCGSEDITTDYWNGLIICRSCGSVICETVYERYNWTVANRGKTLRVETSKRIATHKESHRVKTKGKHMVWRNNELINISSYTAYNLINVYEGQASIIKELMEETKRINGLKHRSVKVRLGVAYAAYLHTEKRYSLSMAVKKAAQRLYIGENNLRTAFKIYLSAKERDMNNGEKTNEKNAT